jgi:nucleotide-binding universal stress UspA family protein
MFHNILVSVDASRHSDAALSEAIDLAESGNARLTILTAVPKATTWTPTAAAAAEALGPELEREAALTLSRAVDRVPASIPVTKILTHEPIRGALNKQLETGSYDLLVMGSRGRGALAASLLGSVSHYALNHGRVPVLIVHASEDAADAGAENRPAAAPTTA